MTVIGGIDLGNLTDYLFFFADGREDANWQGATKGYIGDVAIDGIQADQRTSGSVPYAGTIYTNDATLGAWQNIINQPVNAGQATGVTNEVARIAGLETDLISAIQQINALPASPGFSSVSSTSLNGLNTQNGINEVFVINITSGLNFSTKINITGDPGDVFILRWDTDGNPTNGYQGQVKPQSGGAFVPLGGLTPTNFINVAGDINASGGGSTPLPPYPQGPRFNDGQGDLINGGSDLSGGGFFTGYWLTTGRPTTLYPGTGPANTPNAIYFGETAPLSNGIFVGGWSTLTTKFSMTSGTSGVYVSPNPATIQQLEPAITIEKFVSVDGGTTFENADFPPGPILDLSQFPNVQFRYVVTNTGNDILDNVDVTDNVYGDIILDQTLDPGQSFVQTISVAGQLGQQTNTGTVTAVGRDTQQQVTDSDDANYEGAQVGVSIELRKEVSPDGGLTWFDANTPPGPTVISPETPQFRYTARNPGNPGDDTLIDVEITDTDFGTIATGLTLAPGVSQTFVINPGILQEGEQMNVSTAIGTGQTTGIEVTDTDPAFYFGLQEEPNPSISIEKLVSVDDGATFVPANVSPGPLLPPGGTPQFKFIVTNTGNTPLQNITITDSVYGVIDTILNMVPGEIDEIIFMPYELEKEQKDTFKMERSHFGYLFFEN